MPAVKPADNQARQIDGGLEIILNQCFRQNAMPAILHPPERA